MDLVEDRYVGMKARGVYETPGGTLLHQARRALESITMDREVMRLRDSLIPKYSQLVYNGYWFSPERELLQKNHGWLPGECDRPGPAEALQGKCHGGWKAIEFLSL